MTMSEFDDATYKAVRQYGVRMLAMTVNEVLHQVEDMIVGEAKQYYGTDKGQGMLQAAEIVRLNMTPEEIV